MDSKNMIDVKNVKAEFLPCLNYAMAVNGQKCLEFIEISNPTADDWHGVQVKVSGDLIADASYVIDTVPAGMTVRVTDLDVKPDLDKLRDARRLRHTECPAAVAGEDERRRDS